jgi:hypothetical protein
MPHLIGAALTRTFGGRPHGKLRHLEPGFEFLDVEDLVLFDFVLFHLPAPFIHFILVTPRQIVIVTP